jgi:hypothetical protein
VIVGGRRVFIPSLFIHKATYAAGDVVTFQVLRTYAKQEGLVA